MINNNYLKSPIAKFNFGKNSVFNTLAQYGPDVTIWIRFVNNKRYSPVSDCYEIMEPYLANWTTYNLYYLESGDIDSMIDEEL